MGGVLPKYDGEIKILSSALMRVEFRHGRTLNYDLTGRGVGFSALVLQETVGRKRGF